VGAVGPLGRFPALYMNSIDMADYRLHSSSSSTTTIKVRRKQFAEFVPRINHLGVRNPNSCWAVIEELLITAGVLHI